jgi:undecaprenyl diphosphate synthase
MALVIPEHVAIIMDGNGRWARGHGLPRMAGHRRGAEAILPIVRHAREMGIRAISLFCFSTENWQRPAAEVGGLMRLMNVLLRRYRKTFMEDGTRFHWLGNPDGLPPGMVRQLRELVAATVDRDTFHLALAINYSGRDEILRVCRGMDGNVPADWMEIAARLDTAHLPDVDLLIRTSGERRLSNFLPLQSAYAELYFTPCLWPDFDVREFQLAIDDFSKRSRRFGAVE